MDASSDPVQADTPSRPMAMNQTSRPAAATGPQRVGAAADDDLAVAPSAVLRVLLRCTALLSTAGIAIEVTKVRYGHPSLYGLGHLFDLDAELTVPAYFQALMLLASGLLLAVIRRVHRRRGDPWIRHWTILAAGFVYMSFDEAAGIHELMNRPMRELLHAPGFASAWLIPAGVIVLGLAIYFLPFVLALPRRYLLLFGGSGLLYVFGAAGCEAFGAAVLEPYFPWPSLFSAEVVVEETCEMLGLACFIYSLLNYLGHLGGAHRLRIIQAVGEL